MTFEQAYEIAQYAEKAVGVPASFLLAVLDRESRLGFNLGRCTYNKNPYYPEKASNSNSMHPTRDIPAFLELTKSLGLDPETTQVSCPIPNDGAYGGAVGPGQFLPSTWKLYSASIEKVVGATPNPWNNSHAFVGTALYLRDAMNACTGPTYGSGNGQIKCAAARYYAGGRWSKFISSYGSATLNRKKQFDEDIAVLNGG
jgi:membrane-bound lytic murein transglycosylase B